jgi:hypothetical protein
MRPPFLFVEWAPMKPLVPSRRALIVAAGASLLPLRPSLAAGLVATPAQTEGPFYPTALPADMDNDLVQVRGHPLQQVGQVVLAVRRQRALDILGLAAVPVRRHDHPPGHRVRHLRAVHLAQHLQRQVHRGGGAGAGHDRGLGHVEHVRVQLDVGKQGPEPVRVEPVRGRPPPGQQPRVRQREGARAEAEQPGAAVGGRV